MAFPYPGFRSMAKLWVKIDLKGKAYEQVTDWFKYQPEDTRFEVLTNTDDNSLHIYTR